MANNNNNNNVSYNNSDNVVASYVVVTGTTDRVCIIMGHAACVREAHDVIWEKIRSRVDTSKIGMEELQVHAVKLYN